MDFEHDYILRLIHMMGDMMRRIAELTDDLQRMHALDDACRDSCGMTLETARSLTTESLLALMEPMPRFLLSELLAARADACAFDDDEAACLRLKALRLLASLCGNSVLCPLRAEQLAALKHAVFPLLSADDLMQCARFFAQAERYDEMEDALFQALPLEDGEAREKDRCEAIAMLRRAAASSARTLALCRMTPQELRESAHELECAK